jgi:hypothetical protein
MRDLFELFPDLPWPRRRSLADRIREIGRRVDAVRERARASAAGQRANVLRTRQKWEACAGKSR